MGVIEVPLLDPVTFDSEGTRAAVEKHGMSIVCSLGLPESADVVGDTDGVASFLDKVLLAAREAGSESLSGVTYGTIGKTSGAPQAQANRCDSRDDLCLPSPPFSDQEGDGEGEQRAHGSRSDVVATNPAEDEPGAEPGSHYPMHCGRA